MNVMACQNIDQKLGNGSFCTCTVLIWPETLTNAHQVLKYAVRNCWICRLVHHGICNYSPEVMAQHWSPSSCNTSQLPPFLVLSILLF